MRTFKFAFAFAFALALPLAALAQTTGTDAQAASLIAQISALEQEIASLSSSVQTQSSVLASEPVTSSACPDLSASLSLGSTGSQVSSLQLFLTEQGYFENTISGYFDVATQAAVQDWQASHGIVSEGSPSTTGFGAVGPRTRASIEEACGGSLNTNPYQQTQCIQTQPPTTECETGWQPVSDTSGCTVYYQCAIPLPSAASSSAAGAATSSASQSCTSVPQPICSGTVEPFQTNSNGCVTSYQCVL